MQRHSEEEEEAKRRRGKKEMTRGPIYKVKGGGNRHENQGVGMLDT